MTEWWEVDILDLESHEVDVSIIKSTFVLKRSPIIRRGKLFMLREDTERFRRQQHRKVSYTEYTFFTALVYTYKDHPKDHPWIVLRSY